MPISIPQANNLTDLFSLKWKVIVVTGASNPRGIGFEAARGCTEMGTSVAITYFTREDSANQNAEALTKEYNVKVQAYHCDIRDYAAAKALVDNVLRDFGQIDGFIANAGRAADAGVLEGSIAGWMEIVQTDLNGTFHCAKTVGEHFKARGRGLFVVTSSMSGHIANFP